MTHETASPEDLLQHARWLRALALRLARDEASAEDLVQETWATALRRAPRRDELRSWLTRAIERLARHGRRGDLRRRHRERIAAAGRPERTDADVQEAFEAQRVLARLVEELQDPYRTLVMRRYYDGYTAAQIARRAGVPAATVRSQLARARTLLRQRWDARVEPGTHRGFAGLALIAGVAPETLQGGVLMKSSHAGILTAACALAVALVWGTGALTPSISRPQLEDRDDASLVRVDPTEEETPPADELDAAAEESERRAMASVEAGDGTTAEPPPTRLIARVVDEGGHPIAGARFDAPQQGGFGSVESDPTGHLALVTDRENIQIWQGRVVPRLFRIRATGHATLFIRAALTRDAETDLGDVVLGPGGDIVGRVIDGSGTAVAGALIVFGEAALGAAADDARRSGPRGDDERIETQTEADGTYRLEGVAAGGGRAWAQVTGWPWAFTETLDVTAGSESRAPDMVLTPPDPKTLISGVVVGPNSAPVAGALVMASGLTPGQIRYVRATADGLGRFEIMGFDLGPHRLGAFHPEAELTPAYEARVMPGTDDVEMRLTQLNEIEIQLVDDQSGEPVEKPWLNIDARGGMDFASGVPRKKKEEVGAGRMRVALPASSFTIGASATGYAHKSLGPFSHEAMPAVFEIRLERKPIVSGRVLADGKPVEGARVQTMRDMSTAFAIMTEGFRTRIFDGGAYATETDEEGRFEHPVSAALPNGAHVLLASKEGWAPGELVVEIDEKGASGLELELTRGGAIEGHVLLPAGKVARGALVAASNGDGSVRTTRADEGGFYRLETLAAGPWEVHFREDDEEFSMTQVAAPPEEPYAGDCVVLEGQTTTHNLDLRAAEIKIAGQLVIDGQPCSGWTARLEDAESIFEDDIAGSAVLDAAGAFELTNDGRAIRLFLETPETASAFTRILRVIEKDTDDADASLTVTTGSVTGTAPARARLRLATKITGGWFYHVFVTAGADGSFAAKVPGGKVTIAVERVESGKFTRFAEAVRVDVRAQETTRVDVE